MTIQQRWQQFAPSERRALIIGASALLLFSFWSLIWEPLQTQTQQTEKKLAKLEADYAWMQQAAPQIQALQNSAKKPNASGSSLLSLIDKSLQASPLANINKRISPRNETQAQVDFEQVGFNPFITWLSGLLSQEAIEVVYLTIEAGKDSGMVQVRLSLRQP